MSDPQTLREDAYRAFKRNGLDPEVQLALDREYRSAEADARIVLTDDGFLDFLATYLSREHTKLQAHERGEPNDHPYEGVRKQPLCLCGDRYCELKDGRLMRHIREANDPEAAIREEKHDHRGDPLVLQDAIAEYDDICAAFNQRHRRIIICGTHNVHPDDLDDLRDGDEANDEESDRSTSVDSSHTAATADD